MPLLLSIALLSASALAYQLLLMRLLSIVHWYPFAAMIVSLALLGHGVSGTVLSFCVRLVRARFELCYAVCAAAFGLCAPLAFALAQRVGFNGLELVWDPGQVLQLAAIYLLLSVPFFLAASCFGMAFIALGDRIPRLYAADLAGAGAGAALLIALLYALPLHAVLRAIALGGFAAAALVGIAAGRRAWALGGVGLGLAFALALPTPWIAPRVNPFKGLPKALLLPGAHVVEERSSPFGLVSVLESPEVPLRHVPGLSLNASQEPAPQLGLYFDGDGPSPITAAGGAPHALDYLGQTTSALPYALLEAPRVLIVGAGGGTSVRQALVLGARAVDALELDPQVAQLVRERHAAFSGRLYQDPRVRLVLGDARNALRTSSDAYDLIELPLLDSAAGSGGGVQAAADSFLYTIEALRDAYARLRPGGYLAATRWETQPPRDSLKLFATAVAALEAEGVAEPGAHLLLIRGWQTSTLLLKRGAVSAGDIARLRAFCTRWSFDPAWFPGLEAAEANRHNAVEGQYLFEGARALLGSESAEYIAAYKFRIEPATDDLPFFHNFFKWRSLPELVRLRGAGAAALLDSGYLVLAGAFAQALPLALLLILLPLLASRRAPAPIPRWPPALYFLALGLGFLFVEIAALSRFSLFVGHPLWAATTVLAAMLGGAGCGSAWSMRWRGTRAASVAAALVVALLLSYEALLPAAFGVAAGWSIPLKALASVALLAPLGFVMGMPFPLGLSRLGERAPELVPWAWGINGCASVLAALLAVLLAMEFGYRAVVLSAAGLYALAAILWQRSIER